MSNPGFEFDVDRSVLKKISVDTGTYTLEAFDVLARREGKIIDGTAELLIPPTTNLLTLLQHQSFTISGAAVLDALKSSSLPENTQTDVCRHFALQTVPVHLLRDSEEATFSTFERESIKGLAAHPELRDHVDYLADFYAATTGRPEMSRYARIGAGIVAHKLDVSVDAVLSIEAANWTGVSNLREIDWDAELAKMTGNE